MFGTGCGTTQDSSQGGLSATGSGSGSGTTSGFVRVDLISDQAGIARFQNVDLINPWGLVADAHAFWIANNGSGKLTAVDATGAPSREQPNRVDLAEGITGIAINASEAFQVHAGAACAPATMLVASEDGVVFGFNPAVSDKAIVVIDRSGVGASYKGLAIIDVPGIGEELLAADFHNARIDVFDANFQLVSAPRGPVVLPPVGPSSVGPSVLRMSSSTSSHMFAPPRLDAGMAPFNVALVNDQVYVTYAVQDADKADDVAGVGNGRIDVFDVHGTFVKTLLDGGVLNAPWGLALAPADFCSTTANKVIVGNFGDGTLLAIDPVSGASGQLLASNGRVLQIPGLRGLAFGNGQGVGRANALYFTAGVDDETHGFFGYVIAADQQP
jgi:uncharacterized protein (TIGR03118 family)